MNLINNYINGQEVSFSKNKLPVYDPSTGEVISQVVKSNEEDLKKII